MKWTPEQQRVRAHLRDGACRGGLEPDFLEAIGYVESNWTMEARNLTGPDGARGGSYGPTQISQQTARDHGYDGPMERFCEDPYVAATWSAIILNDKRKQMPLVTLADYVAKWNAGRYDGDKNNDGNLEELRPDHPTRKYLERAKRALEMIRREQAGLGGVA